MASGSAGRIPAFTYVGRKVGREPCRYFLVTFPVPVSARDTRAGRCPVASVVGHAALALGAQASRLLLVGCLRQHGGLTDHRLVTLAGEAGFGEAGLLDRARWGLGLAHQAPSAAWSGSRCPGGEARPTIVRIERRLGVGRPCNAGGHCQQTHLAPERSCQRLRGRPQLDRAQLGFGLRANLALVDAMPIAGTNSVRLTASSRLVIPHGPDGLRLGGLRSSPPGFLRAPPHPTPTP